MCKQIICLQRSDCQILFNVMIAILLSLDIIIVSQQSDSLVPFVIIDILNTHNKSYFI